MPRGGAADGPARPVRGPVDGVATRRTLDGIQGGSAALGGPRLGGLLVVGPREL